MDRPLWVEGEMCYGCRGPIQQPKTGRRRKYCSNACRQKRYRRRKKWQNYETWEEKQRRLGDERAAEAIQKFGELDWDVTYRLSRGMPVFYCRECGRPYGPGYQGPVRQFCNTKCRHAWWNRRLAVTRKQEALATQIQERAARGETGDALERDRERYQSVNRALARDEVVK